MSINLSKSTVLITGASSGFGAEFARQLAPFCDTLILTARRKERLINLEKIIKKINNDCKVEFVCADLAKVNGPYKVIEFLKDNRLVPNILINNAGIGDIGLFEDSSIGRIEDLISVNITSLCKLTRLLLPAMKEINSCGILNVSSVASLFPIPGFSIYAASKSFVTSFSESLRIELKPCQINVTALCPGPVKTEFLDTAKRLNFSHDVKHLSDTKILKTTSSRVVIDGINGLLKNKARVYPGKNVNYLSKLVELVPPDLIRPFAGLSLKRFRKKD